MEIKYENGRVQKIFSDYSIVTKRVGFEITKTLKKRIEQIRAAVNFQNWLITKLGNPHPLTEGSGYRYYGVSVTPNVRLILRPDTCDHSPESFSKCTAVVVKGVCDYHGDKTNWFIS